MSNQIANVSFYKAGYDLAGHVLDQDAFHVVMGGEDRILTFEDFENGLEGALADLPEWAEHADQVWGMLEEEAPGAARLACLLQDRRKNARLTQAELSERTGISQGALSRFENGEISITPKSLDRIMVALSVGQRARMRFILDWFEEQLQD